ncbi:phage holin family protein [Litorilinea aerophila]|uniref:Phage holin family protein n=1 Tax=Litorilinea aerophila TaxID=1204385 RepID=A0A540VD82_9CHLR|nr:phage holin family protein [Litorilinea aerophila]MCC9077428.1 phage holin family protein [Litorilinea aerophila]OUC06679.1 membrane protein [Litorilinea aerophila]GIV77600.1 MAG: hypothetical protein KatS3mg050_1994 [Litorilinea sp.]
MLTHFIVTWLVTAVSLLILSKLPLGIEIDDFGTALVSALVLGLLNAFVRPVLAFFTFPITVLTLGLFTFVLNAIIFWLAAALVDGFRLRGGWLAALIGPIALGLLNGLLLALIR